MIEELTLSTVRAKVATVEEALALGFDEESVGVSRGVVDEIGSDREFADGKRLPGFEVVEVERVAISADEELRGIDQAASQLADVDRSGPGEDG
jgi:hypothetical protein